MTAAEYEFTFVDSPPPPSRGRNGLYDAFRNALRARPGEWAVWPRELKNKATAWQTVGNINRGDGAWRPVGSFEARSSEAAVYVRFIGDAS